MLETIVRGWKTEDCLLVRMTRTVARDRNMIVRKKMLGQVLSFSFVILLRMRTELRRALQIQLQWQIFLFHSEWQTVWEIFKASTLFLNRVSELAKELP